MSPHPYLAWVTPDAGYDDVQNIRRVDQRSHEPGSLKIHFGMPHGRLLHAQLANEMKIAQCSTSKCSALAGYGKTQRRSTEIFRRFISASSFRSANESVRECLGPTTRLQATIYHDFRQLDVCLTGVKRCFILPRNLQRPHSSPLIHP